MYEFLLNLSKELNTQDNRATADPYFFQVQTVEDVAAYPSCGTEILIDSDGFEIRTLEELKDYTGDYELLEYESGSDDIDDMLEYLEEQFPMDSWRIVEVTERKNLENFFFTEKACHHHIERNKHNMNEPQSYVSYGNRNPELEQVIKFLKSIQSQSNDWKRKKTVYRFWEIKAHRG